MPDIVCMRCKYIGKPKRIKRGSSNVEFMCWMIFPFGIPYTIWRILNKQSICMQCDSEVIVSADSIAGLRMIKILNADDTKEELPSFEDWEKSLKTSSTSIAPEKSVSSQKDPNVW
ncbi:MAG: hypothetical protein WCJ33_08545 [Pseudomonadota bacterium]